VILKLLHMFYRPVNYISVVVRFETSNEKQNKDNIFNAF
jgi:hypothetical protein